MDNRTSQTNLDWDNVALVVQLIRGMFSKFVAKEKSLSQLRRQRMSESGYSRRHYVHGRGDCSLAFTVNYSSRDMIFYDFLGCKFYRECFLRLTMCFAEKSPAKSTETKRKD